MYLFTIAELANKFIGVTIISTLSRILGVDGFVQYTTIMLLFGYLLELSFFSYQKKNIVDLSEGNESIIYRSDFFQRIWLMIATSLTAIVLLFVSNNEWQLDILPLSMILVLPIITFDYYLYALNLNRYIIISRFIAQIIACSLFFGFYFFNLDKKNIFYVNLIQSITLTFFVLYFSIRIGEFNIGRLIKSFLSERFSLVQFWDEFLIQKNVFIAKLLVLIIVSYEAVFLSFFKGINTDEMVLGNRLALVLLPFIHFYLDSNVGKVNGKNYSMYMIYNAFGIIIIILASPFIIMMLFGNSYILRGFFLNYYLIFILFQAYVNYTFYLSIKNNTFLCFANKLGFTLVVSILLMILLIKLGSLTTTSLFCLVLFKICLTISISDSLPNKEKLFTCMLFLLPISINYFLIKTGYFLAILEYYNHAYNYLNNYYIQLI